ncbi:MAG: peptidoglycan editing factor PgeF [Oscillospiraceae bacterium]
MAFAERTINGVTVLQSTLIPMRHCFTTRFGGVSEGAFASLNLGENRGDKPEHVRENYHRLAAALGFNEKNLVFTRQVHGNAVRYVTHEDSRELYAPIRYECDGLVTDEPGLPILCFTADCVPVLLCDMRAHVAAAVHCGWRSSVKDILGVAVGMMQRYGASPKNIYAAIGPAIGACCFEVGTDVPEALRAWLGQDAEKFIYPHPHREAKYLVDLRGANRKRLITLGVCSKNIDVSEACTMCSPEKFWSHRVTQGVRGSQAAVIIP